MSRLRVFTIGFFSTVIGAALLYLGTATLTGSLIIGLTALSIGSLLGSMAGWSILSHFREWSGLQSYTRQVHNN